MVDGWRAYVQMATGVGELTAARAREVAKSVVGGAGKTLPGGAPELAGSVAAVAEDLLASARANRGLLIETVRGEVERSVATLGLVSPRELTELRERVDGLERRVELLQQARTDRPTDRPADRSSEPRKRTAKRASAKQASAAPKKSTPSKRAEKKTSASAKTTTAKRTAGSARASRTGQG